MVRAWICRAWRPPWSVGWHAGVWAADVGWAGVQLPGPSPNRSPGPVGSLGSGCGSWACGVSGVGLQFLAVCLSAAFLGPSRGPLLAQSPAGPARSSQAPPPACGIKSGQVCVCSGRLPAGGCRRQRASPVSHPEPGRGGGGGRAAGWRDGARCRPGLGTGRGPGGGGGLGAACGLLEELRQAQSWARGLRTPRGQRFPACGPGRA